MLAVALPQGRDQLGSPLAPMGEEPLLELVEDQQHLAARRQALAAPERRQRLDQARVVGQARKSLANPAQQARLRLAGRRLDVDRQRRGGPAAAAAPP